MAVRQPIQIDLERVDELIADEEAALEAEQRAKDKQNDELGAVQTTDSGDAEFDLRLQRRPGRHPGARTLRGGGADRRRVFGGR